MTARVYWNGEVLGAARVDGGLLVQLAYQVPEHQRDDANLERIKSSLVGAINAIEVRVSDRLNQGEATQGSE